MRAINHAATGALIGVAVSNPLAAVPLAFASHFICDAIPHHGNSGDETAIRSRRFLLLLVADALLCLLLVVVLAAAQPANWLLAAVCAFIATLPDFAWLPGYMRVRNKKPYKIAGQHAVVKLASKIQWFERPIGAVVEIAWFIGMVVLLYPFL